MIKVLKDSFLILKNNMLFMQPLLLFLLFVFIAIPYLTPLNTNIIAKIILIITIGLIFCAFFSGWFYINKLCIETYNEADEQIETTKKSIENIKEFFTGVGQNFLKCVSAYTIILLFNVLVMSLTIKYGIENYGIIETDKLQNAKDLLNTLSLEEKTTLSKWILTIIPLSFITQYMFVLYNAVLFTDNKNIFITFINCFKFFFKNIGINIGLIILLPIIQFMINVPLELFGNNILIGTISIIITTIYFVFYTIVIFRLYSEKTKTNSNNGAEFIREDSSCDSSI